MICKTGVGGRGTGDEGTGEQGNEVEVLRRGRA